MKDKKHTWEIFSFYDRSGLEKRLTRMAEKGWLLEEINSSRWTYRRIEPQKLTFCVCWFPMASSFDPEPSEKQRTFYDFCQHTGWILAGSFGQMQVFYNEAADPTPIETDPLTEIEAIHSAMKRSSLPAQLVILLLALLNGGLFVSDFLRDPASILANNAKLFTGLCWAVVILLVVTDCGSYFLWRRRALKAAERGEFLETKGHRTFQLACLAVVGLALLCYLISVAVSGNRLMAVTTLLMFVVYLPAVFGLTYGVRALLKKKKVSAKINRIATILTAFAAAFIMMAVITASLIGAVSFGWL